MGTRILAIDIAVVDLINSTREIIKDTYITGMHRKAFLWPTGLSNTFRGNKNGPHHLGIIGRPREMLNAELDYLGYDGEKRKRVHTHDIVAL
jgi:hypothetical protein